MMRRPQRPQKPQQKEEYAIVLDVIVNNQSFKDSETIQAVGTTSFTLLELVAKPGVSVRAGDKVYIGDGKREEIQYIKRSVELDDLTGAARSELDYVLEELIEERESDFINFFNNGGPITIRKHSLELIPGIGKKHLTDLLEARDEKPFESFAEMKERCSFFTDPVKAITERIVKEIEDKEEFKLFVRK